jgi:hypothetical protein
MNELIFVLSAISMDIHVHLRASSAANELNAAKRKLLRPWRDWPEPRQLIRKGPSAPRVKSMQRQSRPGADR